MGNYFQHRWVFIIHKTNLVIEIKIFLNVIFVRSLKVLLQALSHLLIYFDEHQFIVGVKA